MVAASRALSRGAERWRGRLLRLLPSLALLGGGVVALLASPESHYGLFLAIAPCLAAAIHGVQVTALIGALSVAVYVALHFDEAEDQSDIWFVKLALIVAAAFVGILISRTRVSERRLLANRAISLTLQQGLLPGGFRETSAVEVAHRYVPADTEAGVGGDWFDVIQLSGSRVALVVGDVVGHGVHAAAMMGRLRTAVHTLADLDLAPEELLTRMDDLVVRFAEDEKEAVVGASCLYLIYDPITRRCVLASAGHPPPVIADPAGGAYFPELPENPPLGLGATPYESVEFQLAEGSVVALYTDGLLGLRHNPADEALARLAAALTPATRPLPVISADVFRALPAGRHDDDMALLLARTRVVDDTRVASWDFPAEPRIVSEARAVAVDRLTSWGLEAHAFLTELVVSELVTNAVRYGTGPVHLRLIYDHALICEVSDHSATAPHLRHARTTDEGGRGLYLVGRLTSRWGTRYTDTGKTIWAEQPLTAPLPEPSAVLAALEG